MVWYHGSGANCIHVSLDLKTDQGISPVDSVRPTGNPAQCSLWSEGGSDHHVVNYNCWLADILLG